MRCYVHADIEAVGTCRACNKGLCHHCVADLGHSISCKGGCEKKANVLNSQVMQSSVVLQTQRRNRFFAPAFFIVMGIVFMLFASDGSFGMNLGTVMGSGFIAFGIILAILGQRYAKELNQKA
jgi:hypothetical protein